MVIVSAVRTAIGKFGGSLKDISPAQLGSAVLKDALSKAGAGAGIPVEVSSDCVNKVCGSGLKPTW